MIKNIAIVITLYAVIPFLCVGKTIVFDFSGTILEKSESLWIEEARKIALKYNIIIPDTDEEMRSATFGEALKKSNVSNEVYKKFILETWQQYYNNNADIKPDAKMIPILKKLKTDGHTIIAMSSNAYAAQKIIQALSLSNYFDTIWQVPTIQDSTLIFEDNMFEIKEQMDDIENKANACTDSPIFVVKLVDSVNSYVKRNLNVIGIGWRYHHKSLFNKYNLSEHCAENHQQLYDLISAN